jgi:hypothetical protein
LPSHQLDLTATSSPDVSPLPRHKLPSSCKTRKDAKQHPPKQPSGDISHPDAMDSIPRPLQSYTPQLSPLAGECDHNLTSLLPSPKTKPLPTTNTTTSASQVESSPPAPPPLASKKTDRLPPTPPIKDRNRPTLKVQCSPQQPLAHPPHQWHIHKQPPFKTSNNNNNNNTYRQLRVINIDHVDTDITADLDASAHHAHRGQGRYSTAAADVDSSDDSSLSDNNDLPSTNHNMLATMKPYSHDTRPASYYTTDYPTSQQHRPERQKKVSFSSVVTTIPRPTPPPLTLSLADYPENTRGFWEAFSAEMGHHHPHQQTLLDKLDAMKNQHQQQPPTSRCHREDHFPVIPSPSNSNSHRLINKLFLTKPWTDQPSKKPVSTWWKGNGNDPSKKSKVVDTTQVDMDDRPVSQSPPLEHVSDTKKKKTEVVILMHLSLLLCSQPSTGPRNLPALGKKHQVQSCRNPNGANVCLSPHPNIIPARIPLLYSSFLI